MCTLNAERTGLGAEWFEAGYNLQTYEKLEYVIHERNIQLDTQDPVARFGFTQVPNFILGGVIN